MLHNEDTNFIKTFEQNMYIVSGRPIYNSNPNYYITNKVELKENTTYYNAGLYSGYYALYDKNDNILCSLNYAETGDPLLLRNPFITPAGTSYGRFTIHNGDIENAWISIYNKKPEKYNTYVNTDNIKEKEKTFNNYENGEFSVFRNVACIGDSWTNGTFNVNIEGELSVRVYSTYSYPTYLQKISDTKISNLGLGGYTSVQWYDSYKDTDLSGYDCAIIYLGINDISKITEEFEVSSKIAFTNIINKLESENTGIKIFIGTLINTNIQGSDNYKKYVQFNNKLRNMIEEINHENIMILDLEKHNNYQNSNDYRYGHPTAVGYYIFAKDVYKYISYLMNENKSKFKRIQFIGTNL